VILFDLDGVLVDSRRCVERVWRIWAAERALDADRFIGVSYGRRTSETLRAVAPELDVTAETGVLDAMEEVETEGLVAIPGAPELLAALPRDRWAIVTSGSRPVATLRLRTAGLPVPDVFVTGEEVCRGKPDPEPYLTAANRLNLPPADCLVIEDAPAGVQAGVAAGMTVVAVGTTHPPSRLGTAQVIVPGLDRLGVRVEPAGLLLHY
jgi:sugar-phosphatase